LRPAAMGRAAVEQAALGRNAFQHRRFQAGAAHAKIATNLKCASVAVEQAALGRNAFQHRRFRAGAAHS